MAKTKNKTKSPVNSPAQKKALRHGSKQKRQICYSAFHRQNVRRCCKL